MNDLQIVLVANRPFDEAYIHVFGIFLHVHHGTEDKVGLRGEIDQELVEIEERHVAAGTAAEPDSGNS